jgi:DNA-binding NarL/FixJ family response regulator
MITIVLADDHGVVRQALRSLLASQPDFSILAEAGNGHEALAAIERHHPNVAVLDLMMPGLGGLEVTRRVSAHTRVVILSMHDSEAYVVEALRNGALGYVLKDSTADDLLQAVRAAAEGRRFLSAPLSERMIDRYLTKIQSGPLDPYETLTAREREVLQLAAEGLSTVEVSARLSISPRTAEIHRANVMHKLDLHSQTDLIRYAIKKGIIPA